MDKYYRLLNIAADELTILKGNTEDEINYKARIVYSIICRMAHAALWDELEDWSLREEGEQISIIHFKNRIEKTLKGYLEMYSELRTIFSMTTSDLSQYIYNLFGATGQFYHNPYRISPPKHSNALVLKVCFERGVSPLNRVCMSGAGMYSKSAKTDNTINIESMFDLHKASIDKILDPYVENIIWSDIDINGDIEYLNENPQFNRGYWINRPSKEREISIARIKNSGVYNYYFYKNKNRLEYCLIPEYLYHFKPAASYHTSFMIGGLANSVLKRLEKLPPIRYHIDGAVVYVNINYLLPPNEMNLLCLYSWPGDMQNFDSRFKRILSVDVFLAIKSIFELEGFIFLEE